MTEKVYLKRGDLEPKLALTLFDGLDESTRKRVDLSGASAVVFIMARRGVVVIDRRAMDIDQVDEDEATWGDVSMEWVAGDTDTAAEFQGEVEVTWPGVRPQTFPVRRKLGVVIEDDLG